MIAAFPTPPQNDRAEGALFSLFCKIWGGSHTGLSFLRCRARCCRPPSPGPPLHDQTAMRPGQAVGQGLWMSHGGGTAASKIDEVCCAHRTRTAPFERPAGSRADFVWSHVRRPQGRPAAQAPPETTRTRHAPSAPRLHAAVALWPGSREQRGGRTSTAGQLRARTTQISRPSVVHASWRARASQRAPAEPSGVVRARVHTRRRTVPMGWWVVCDRQCVRSAEWCRLGVGPGM